jgi:phosphate/sulfate permease
LGLKVAGGDQPMVACASVSFTNTANRVSTAQDYALLSVAQQEVIARGTDPYWRLVAYGATTVLGIFVGTTVAIKTVTVGVCAASGGRVAATLVYTK